MKEVATPTTENGQVLIPAADDFSDVPIIGTDEKPPVSLRELARIDYTKELPPPAPALRVNGEIFGTLGNFSLVIGKAKSRKTFSMALVMSGALGVKGDSIFEGCLPEEKRKVVFIDTEQGQYHVIKVAKRVARLSGFTESERFEVFGARSLSTQQRVALIDEIVTITPDLGLLVIDGVRDILTSINDEKQATNICNLFLRLTEQHNIHIVGVLHQNKGDFNARGHIGTEMINKAETTVSVTVEKDKEVSKVEVEYSRNKAFEPFAFRVNMFGLPEVIEGWKPKTEDSGNSKYDPFEVDDYKHTEALQLIARNISDKPNYSELQSQVVLAVSETIQKIGNSKARDYITYYINNGFIKKNGKERSPKTYYSVHPYGV